MRNESGRNGRASLADPGDWMLLGKRLGMVALALGTLGLAAGCTGAVGPNTPTTSGGSTPSGSSCTRCGR